MRSCVPPFAWILVFIIPSLVLAIFADEAYHLDYHHALVGIPQPRATFFHRPSAVSRASLLYTLSEKSVLGAINPRDGSVVWRQRLVDEASLVKGKAFLSALDGDNTIYSALNGGVQAWDAADGRTVWDWRGTGTTRALEVLGNDDNQKDVFMLSETDDKIAIVRKFATATGEVLWEFKDDR